MAITPSKYIKPDQGKNNLGSIKLTLEGANDVSKGEIVVLSDGVFGGRDSAVARKFKGSRVTSDGEAGILMVALGDASVGDDLICAEWDLQQLDTSSSSIGAPVYMTAAGVPTLTAGGRVIGSVLTAATVANGGCIAVNPGASGSTSGAGAALSLTAGTEAANAIPVTVAGPAVVAQYRATVLTAAMVPEVVANYTMAETGAGAEVSTTAQPSLLFTTDAAGAATLTVTDVSTTSTDTLYLLVEPAAVSGGAVGGASTIIAITFA